MGIGEAYGPTGPGRVRNADMKYRQILLMTCALCLVPAIAPVQAGELNDYLDEISTALMGTDTTKTVPEAAPTLRSAPPPLTMGVRHGLQNPPRTSTKHDE